MTNPSDTQAVRCEAEASALLIIDIQPRLTAAMPVKVLARLQRNLSLLARAANALEVPAFVTEQYPRQLGGTEPEIRKLLPETAKTYEKSCFSCVDIKGFSEDLAATGRTQVILTGLEAHIGISQTALALFNQGYSIFVVADTVCSRHRENYEIALHRLRQAGVLVSDAESIVFEWVRDAAHEKFKEIQALLT